MTDHPHRLFAGFNGRQVEIRLRLGPARLPGSIAVESPVGCSRPRRSGRPPPDPERASRILRGASRFSRPIRGRLSRARPVFRSKVDDGRLRRRTSAPPLAARRRRGERRGRGAAGGSGGAGKSTLAVRLLERGWRLFGDDVVPVDVDRQAALPLPFTPDVRTTPSEDLCDRRAFVEQPKQVVAIPADRVAREPGLIGAIVLTEYDRDRDARSSLAPIAVVSAAEQLARAVSHPTSDTRGLVAGVFRLAQRTACYRLDYRDATAAAADLAKLPRLRVRSSWPRLLRP